MKDYKTGQLRNMVFLSHQGAGKTTLTESMVLASGAINRPGRVEDGNTVADFEEEEIERHMSLSTGVVAIEWKANKINVLDTPGTFDFVGEVLQSIRVADSALFLVDAVSGVEVGTELTWGHAGDTLPRMVLITKMDRENASFERALNSLNEHFEAQFVPMLLPVGSQSDLAGVVDVVKMKAYMGPEGEEADVPEDMADQVDEARMQLIDVAAESDDELIIKYLDGEELSTEEISRGLQASIAEGAVVPVLAAAGTEGIGVRAVMDAIVSYMPAPPESVTVINMATQEEEELAADASAPLSALVFKTTVDPFGKQSYFRVYSGALESDSRVLNVDTGEEERLGQISVAQGREQIPVGRVIAGDIGVVAKLSETLTGHTLCDRDRPVKLPPIEFPTPIFAVAVNPKTKADSAKMGTGLSRLVEEDPSYEWHLEPSTRQTILSGRGSAHIDIACRRLQRKFGVEVVTSVPKVPYRETITHTAEDTYRHKKQTGGAGQFAQVSMRLEPVEQGTGFVYEWKVFGGAVSTSFRPSIEKGIRSVLETGVLAGYPVVDISVAITDGKEHPVDSKDIAFQIAGREGFKAAFLQAGPVLLEPICDVEISVPDEFMGDVLNDLNTRRGRVMGMNQRAGRSIVTAQVPLSEMQRYSTSLRAITQGRGIYSMKISSYEQVPSHLAEEIVAQARQEAEEGS
ncbi:MAG TPA: elongation factor G [Anaerolineae bacterium]|nr:elongation factor G [Anaerolineae bacterium]